MSLNRNSVSVITAMHRLTDSKIKIIKYYCKDSVRNDHKMILGSHVKSLKQYNL